MMRLDCNAFIGNWPFYKTRFGSLDDLKSIHRENGIDGGYVSSIQSIFYNDPWESELELAEILRGEENYYHVFTINPMLPAWKADIRRAVSSFGIRGVRIVPEIHGYELDDPCMEGLCDLLRELDLPLFLTVHLIDPRSAYLIVPKAIPVPKLEEFIKSSGIRIILCGIRIGEIKALWPNVCDCDVWYDISGFKDSTFAIDECHQQGFSHRMKFGSEYPILCFESSKLLFDYGDIPQDLREKILTEEI